MKHYIITRYNLCLYRMLAKRPGMADSWMFDRFMMFRDFCVPSIKAQTCQNFEWILLFDNYTPRKYLINIKKLIVGINYKIVTIDTKDLKFKEGDSFWIDELKNAIEGNPVMMTRLDCDDMLHKNFVKDLQEYRLLEPREYGYVLDFRYGYMFDTRNCRMFLADHKRVGSPFITLVEKNHPRMGTVYFNSHSKVASYYSRKGLYYVVNNNPNWVMNIHYKNCTNRIFEDMIVNKSNFQKVKGGFGL